MDNRKNDVPSGISLAQLLGHPACQVEDEEDAAGQMIPDFGMAFGTAEAPVAELHASALTIGLIDCYRFSQECLMKAFESIRPRVTLLPFENVPDCINDGHTDFDLIIYYPRANDVPEATAMQNVAAVRQAFPTVPLIVLSDAEDAQQPKIIRSMLKSGAHGLIPTRTTGIAIAIAAIRFVKAGGTFAPLDQLLTNRPDRMPAPPDKTQPSRLTSRQMAVLFHLQRGKANKIIAHELGMSESTVKVHVRNIMRKMDATNRTQAVYKARTLWDGAEIAKAMDL